MKKQKRYFWAYGCAASVMTLLCGCDLEGKLKNVSPDKAAALIEKHVDYYAKHLRTGMSRKDVLALFPQPHNTNTTNVCMWMDDLVGLANTEGKRDWQSLQYHRGGLFIVFVNDKLVTPVCANAAFDPWQAMEHYAGFSNEQAQQILGEKEINVESQPLQKIN